MLANIIHDDVNYKSKNDCVNISLRIQRLSQQISQNDYVNISLRIQRLSQQISLLQRRQSVIGPFHYHCDLT